MQMMSADEGEKPSRMKKKRDGMNIRITETEINTTRRHPNLQAQTRIETNNRQTQEKRPEAKTQHAENLNTQTTTQRIRKTYGKRESEGRKRIGERRRICEI